MMRFLLSFCLIFSFSTAECGRSKKDDGSDNKKAFAVVDVKEIISGSKAGKSIHDQLKKINEESKKELVDLESKIKSMESDKKSYDERKIEDMQLILYGMVRDKKYQILDAQGRAYALLDQKISDAIKEVRIKKEISIVFNSDVIVDGDEKHVRNITPDVINVLDEICPDIAVEMKEQEQKNVGAVSC